ncbi:MAG: thioredoxin [Actinobacteria bacterium]|nr:thioredoxin [Actinomycetota bacterium]
MGASIANLTDSTFDEHLVASDKPVLVDFWADWCTPCKVIAPILEELADEQSEKLTIAKVNIDDATAIAGRFDVMSIPTLILFKDGAPVAKIVGAKPKAALLQEISAYL